MTTGMDSNRNRNQANQQPYQYGNAQQYPAAQPMSQQQAYQQPSSKKRRKKNKPYKLTTVHTWRRRIVSLIVMLLVIAGIWITASVMSGAIPSPLSLLHQNDTSSNASTDTMSLLDTANTATDNTAAATNTAAESQDTAQQADEIINAYYKGLAANDSASLHAIGADDAASAIERGWLTRIHYTVNNVSTADADALPSSSDTYAGSTLYPVSAFMPASQATITSDITGTTPLSAWIWFNQESNTWQIVDPTIPTAIYMPKSTTTTMKNSDGTAQATVTTQGALANPWWAYMTEDISINTSSTVKLTKNKFDNGITANIPASLNGTTSSTSGTITIYRGNLSSFSPSKIGQSALKMTGNMTAISIETSTQDITPDMEIE